MRVNQNVMCLSYGKGGFTEYDLKYSNGHGQEPPLQNGKPQKKKFPILVLVVFLAAIIGSLLTSPVFWELIGDEDITQKPDGTYCYLVNVQNDNNGPYALPAEINKVGRRYFVDRIFWSDGGYIDTDKELFLNEPVPVEDQDLVKWNVTLQNIKEFHSDVKETTVFNDINTMTFFWIEMVVPTIIFAIFLIWYYKFYNKNH